MQTETYISEARKQYINADAKGKNLLEAIFGKEFFKSVEDQVSSIEAACTIIGVDFKAAFSKEVLIMLEPHEVAYREVEYVCRAINKLTGFVPDYTNTNQNKYFPRFYNGSSGVGFSDVGYAYDATDTSVGCRLVVGTSQLALFIGKKYMKSYHILMGLQ
jgi:hypothetical protein